MKPRNFFVLTLLSTHLPYQRHGPMRHSRDTEPQENGVTEAEYDRKLDQLDTLLNDPDVPMEPEKVWSLLAEISQRDLSLSSAANSAAH